MLHVSLIVFPVTISVDTYIMLFLIVLSSGGSSSATAYPSH